MENADLRGSLETDNIHVEIHVDLVKSDVEHPHWPLIAHSIGNRGLYSSTQAESGRFENRQNRFPLALNRSGKR